MLFGRASEFPVPFSFPSSRKLHLQVSFPNPPQTKAGQENKLSLSSSSPRYCTRHGPIIYGSQSTSSSVHHVHYALSICLSCLSTALLGFLIPTTFSLLFPLSLLVCPSASVYVCVESLLEFAGQGGALREMDFSQH